MRTPKPIPTSFPGGGALNLSTCYELIAAVHGARDWNTLCASATGPVSASAFRQVVLEELCQPTDSEGNPVFCGVPRGGIGVLAGRTGAGKTRAVQSALTDLLVNGGEWTTATVVDAGRSYFNLTENLGGLNLTAEQFLLHSSLDSAVLKTFQTVPLATVEMEVLLQDTLPSSMDFLQLFGHLLRQRPNRRHVLVLDELGYLLRGVGTAWPQFAQLLDLARHQGTTVLLMAQSLTDFGPLEALLAPDCRLELTTKKT